MQHYLKRRYSRIGAHSGTHSNRNTVTVSRRSSTEAEPLATAAAAACSAQWAKCDFDWEEEGRVGGTCSMSHTVCTRDSLRWK